jgi:DNA modification methylase
MTDDFTNVERKVASYRDNRQPTVASDVAPDTPLETLNLNWREKDLPERERTKHVHRLHPYLGKFIPQLVEVFLRKYFVPGQTILDPFAGSGTTLVQANELGINALGCDISAFNILLCKAKTAHYDLRQLHDEIRDVLRQTRSAVKDDFAQLPLFAHLSENGTNPTERNEYLRTWYAPQALRQLLAYRDCVDNRTYQYKDLLRIILSRSARSARLTTHFDLDFPKKPQTEPYWCYKHSRTCYPTVDALKFLERYSEDTLKRVREFASVRTNATVELHHADSRDVVFPPIDGVITSPPYVGLIDYHEQHAYAYHLLGLQDRREREIGAAAAGSSKRAQKEYQRQIAEVFRRALNAMPTGGKLIIVAADKADLYGGIAEMLGVEVENIIQRHVNRRTGRRSSEFYESIFVWRKA